ncbi:DUF3892 domain-containing protein [Candidatus Korobacter versatilis]|nr:DUF3892 domain-containing protein [Candidatus Koribacter versatilis]
MARFRITCTIHSEDHERIAEVGCDDGSRFTESEAIARIENQGDEFVVDRPQGHTAKVIVEKTKEGRKFLKTEADGEKPNNLLSLPTCKKHVETPPPPRVVVPARSHGVRW